MTIEQRIERLEKQVGIALDVDPATHDPRDGRPWPPRGVAIQVRDSESEFWRCVISVGSGRFQDAHPESVLLSVWKQWRYIPVDWEWAPKWAVQWLVVDSGESKWLHQMYNPSKVGGKDVSGRVVHVENRPESGDE